MPRVILTAAIRAQLDALPAGRRTLAHEMIMDIASGKTAEATPYVPEIPGSFRLERGAVTLLYLVAGDEVDLLVVITDS